MADVEKVTVECDDRGFELHLIVGDDVKQADDGRVILNIQAVAEDLWDEMVKKVGPWVLEKAAAKRDYDRIQENGGYHNNGPWPGESAFNYWERTGDPEPLLNMADALRDQARDK